MTETDSYPHTARSRFTVTAWEEHLVVDQDGEGTRQGASYYPSRGLTRAEASYAYTGDLVGRSTVSYLIGYRPDGAAPVVGMERFEGALEGQQGSVVLRHVGEQDAGAVSARLEVVPGMGTGELARLRGEAELRIAGHSDDGYELVMSYALE